MAKTSKRYKPLFAFTKTKQKQLAAEDKTADTKQIQLAAEDKTAEAKQVQLAAVDDTAEAKLRQMVNKQTTDFLLKTWSSPSKPVSGVIVRGI